MNAQAQQDWQSFLDEVTATESKHYLWLRSLSYLEYIGYRKMVKALGYDNVNKGVYHHLTDEIQHSYMLRELAEKNFGRQKGESFSQEYQDIAEDYFQKIDGEIDAWVQRANGAENPLYCYLLTSFIVEKRAMSVYPHYYSRLSEAPSKIIIQKIIKDESEHLSYLEGKMPLVPGFSEGEADALLAFESECFSEYLRRMQACFHRAYAA